MVALCLAPHIDVLARLANPESQVTQEGPPFLDE